MIQWFCMLTGWVVADLLWFRWAARRLRPLRWAKAWRALLGLFILIQIAFVMSMLVGSVLDRPLMVKPILWPVSAYLWHIFIMPGSILGIAILWSMRRMFSRHSKGSAPVPQTDIPLEAPRMTRRDVLAVFGAATPPLMAVGVGVITVDRLGEFAVRLVDLKLPGLPADLDGLSIAHISDLHIGRFLPAGVMERAADATNAMEADLIAFTGDLIDVSCQTASPGIDFVKRLRPRHGLVMIEGNHDGMSGADRFEGDIKSAGLPLLLDETMTFNIPGRSTAVQFMGITWGELKIGKDIGRRGRERERKYRVFKDEAQASSVGTVAGQRKPGAFPILLAHHPHALDDAAAHGLPLVLSGHTHGGQLMLTKDFGVGSLRFKYWTGLYERGNTRLFVNNGIGSWFPLRVNAPAEIVKLTLRRA